MREDGTPFYTRNGEKVGGGYFIFRRGEKANRIKPGNMPFEHPSLESAMAEVERLLSVNPNNKLCILQEVSI